MESDNTKKNKKERKNRKDKKNKKGVWKKIFIGLLIFFLLVGAAGVGVVAAIIKTTPTVDFDIISNLNESSKIYDDEGNFIENYSGEEIRFIVSLDKIPAHVQEAFISIEDERFRTHNGVDIKRIFGALWADIKSMSLAEGASTITQQLIKNYSLTNAKTWTRKIQEAYLALQLERVKSKNEILNAYLNTISIGPNNKYGVQAASKYYFGKDIQDVNVAEGALLAGMIQYPSKFNPFSKKNLEDPTPYIDRTKVVLNRMKRNNKITQEEYDVAIKDLTESLHGRIKEQYAKKESSTAYMKYQWFIEPAMDQIAEDFAEKYGITKSEAKQKLRTQGYNIYLTVDQKIQQTTENVINNYSGYPKIRDKYASSKVSIYDENISQPQGAGVIIDVTNGHIKAVVGGKGPHPALSANRATDIQRQPGSTIKPLGVYAPAIETKVATAGTSVNDSALTAKQAKSLGWKSGSGPKNYDGAFKGIMTLRSAVMDSRNLAAVKIWDLVGSSTSVDFVKNKFHLGDNVVTTSKNGKTDTGAASLALGGMTHGTTPLKMAAAYSVFANNGMYSEPMFYTKVTDNKGQLILERKVEQSRSLSPQAAYIMTDILKDVVTGGTGTAAKLGSMPAAGKTGTTDDNTNAWFVGYTPYYAGAFWIGNDDPKFSFNKTTTTTGTLGGNNVAPMWKQVMSEIHKGLKAKDFTRPNNIVSAQVCIDSGKAPTELCAKDPRGSRVRTELFIKGTEPIELCDAHVEVSIDKTNGKLANEYCPTENVIRQVFIKAPAEDNISNKDKPYIVPTEICNVHNKQTVTPPANNPGGNNGETENPGTGGENGGNNENPGDNNGPGKPENPGNSNGSGNPKKP